MTRPRPLALALLLGALGAALPGAAPLAAQELRVGDLTIDGSAVPQRLMGYGLVVGLDGSGDRATLGRQAGMTVQSVVNLLRRFDLAIPPDMLRTQNVAAVLVTAELSPYLRPGGRFTVHVSALGDARSLRGGVLWTTPLVNEPGGPALATAQGPLVIDDPAPSPTVASQTRWRPRSVASTPVNHGAVPDGGVLDATLPKPAVAVGTQLLLRQPDLSTASRIASAINAALGAGSARLEDPGAVLLTLKGSDEEKLDALGRVRELPVRPAQPGAVFIDARSGLVVAGGEVPVGAAAVRHNRFALVIAGTGMAPGTVADSARGPDPAPAPVASDSAAAPPATPARSVTTAAAAPVPPTDGDRNVIALRLPVGSSVIEVTAALRALEAQPSEVGAVLLALRQVGALPVEVVIR